MKQIMQIFLKGDSPTLNIQVIAPLSVDIFYSYQVMEISEIGDIFVCEMYLFSCTKVQSMKNSPCFP